ncbi:ECF transporter S component [Clostridium minihomine]|uniref:ECF transporter S component n=1 Tax=Clostridium minihomine TaxID=2045012 RepID=UPI000C78DAC9|nr:ECF transporter S component [Clostridium minihomine]
MHKPMSRKKIVHMAQLAMLAAISLVLIAFVRIPLVPAAPFLEYDMADAPILIGALLFGSGPALAVLFVVSTIQAFLFGGNGWIGLVMHFISSGALVLLAGEFYKRKHKFSDAIIGMVLGSIAMTLIMIPMNYIFTVHFFGVPKTVVDAMMLPGIIPFNLLKASLNSGIAAVLFRSLQPFVQKNREMFHPI